MRIPSRHNQETTRDDSFMTPMIDVVFLLLIFFVCASAGQISESHLPTPIAAAGGVQATDSVDPEKKKDKVWVKLYLEGELKGSTRAKLNDTEYVDWKKLRLTLQSIAELQPDSPVILDIAKKVPIGDMIDIFDTCNAAGFEDIRFATSPQK
jgi:biopolymer transport protein ExbD